MHVERAATKSTSTDDILREGSRRRRPAKRSELPPFTLDTEESVRSFDPDWSPPSGGHRIAVAFLCESPEAVDHLYRELVDAGARTHKEPWNAFWGQRYAQVKDPDGNVVDLFAPLVR